MAFKYNKVKEDAFKTMQFHAGVLATDFNITTGELDASKILTATTGGVSVSVVPTYEDLGANVDNCPKNTKELKEVVEWECKMTATALETSIESIELALGCSETADGKVTPRNSVSQEDFKDIWWVGDRKDGATVAVKLLNAMSDSGFALTTNDKSNGTIDLSFVGHATIADSNLVPAEIYVKTYTVAEQS